MQAAASDLDDGAAQCVVELQSAAVRIGLVFRGPSFPTGPPGHMLGRCFALLPPQRALALAWAWQRRSGVISRPAAALLYARLADADAPRRGSGAQSLLASARELEVIASLAPQLHPATARQLPRPVTHRMSSLAAALSAPTVGGGSGVAAMPAHRVAELLAALASAARVWQPLVGWQPLQAALLPEVLREVPSPKALPSLLESLKTLARYMQPTPE